MRHRTGRFADNGPIDAIPRSTHRCGRPGPRFSSHPQTGIVLPDEGRRLDRSGDQRTISPQATASRAARRTTTGPATGQRRHGRSGGGSRQGPWSDRSWGCVRVGLLLRAPGGRARSVLRGVDRCRRRDRLAASHVAPVWAVLWRLAVVRCWRPRVGTGCGERVMETVMARRRAAAVATRWMVGAAVAVLALLAVVVVLGGGVGGVGVRAGARVAVLHGVLQLRGAGGV